VVTQQVRKYPVVAVEMLYKVGSKSEDPSVNGIAHLLEHLLFRGTNNHPVQYMKLFNVLGAEANAVTDHDKTVYTSLVQSEVLEHVLTIEADRVRGALIDLDDVTIEKDVVISELMGYEGSAIYRLDRRLMEQAFGGVQGYGLPIGGTPRSVSTFNQSQVREFYQAHYDPAKATLVLVGDFNITETMGWVFNLFSPTKSSENSTTSSTTALDMKLQHALLWYTMMTGISSFPLELWFERIILTLWSHVYRTPLPKNPSIWLAEDPDTPFISDDFTSSATKSGTFSTTNVANHIKHHLDEHTNSFYRTQAESIIQSFDKRFNLHSTEMSAQIKRHMLTHALDVANQQVDEHAYKIKKLVDEETFHGTYSSFLQMPDDDMQASKSNPSSFVLTFHETIVVDNLSDDQIIVEFLIPMPRLTSSSLHVGAMMVVDELLSGGSWALIPKFMKTFGASISTLDTDLQACLETGWYSIIISADSHDDVDRAKQALGQLFAVMQTQFVFEEHLRSAKLNAFVKLIDGVDSVQNMAASIANDFVMAGDLLHSEYIRRTVLSVNAFHVQFIARSFFKEGSTFIGIHQPPAGSSTSKGKSHLFHQNSQTVRHKRKRIDFDVQTSRSMKGLHRDTDDFHFHTVHPIPHRQLVQHQALARAQQSTLMIQQVGAIGFDDPRDSIKYLLYLPSVLNSILPPVPVATEFVLPNGMKVTLIPSFNSRLVQINGRILIGAINDPPKKTGLNEAIASMLMLGSKRYTAIDFDNTLQRDASQLLISGGIETTAIWGSTLPQSLDRVLIMLSEWLMNPLLNPDTVQLLLRSMSQSSSRSLKDSEARARQLLRRSIFPMSHPLSMSTSPVSLMSITIDDVVTHYQQSIEPSKTNLVISGCFDSKHTKEVIETLFTPWVRNDTTQSIQDFPTVVPNNDYYAEPDTHSADVITLLGRTGVPICHPQYWVAKIANEILGGDTLSSRLGTHVRDKEGLSYGVYSTLEGGFKTSGMHVIRMQSTTDNAKSALAGVLQVLTDFMDGVSEYELEVAKRNLISQHTLSLETAEDVGAFLLGRQICADSQPVELRKEVAKVRDQIYGVTKLDVNAHIQLRLRPEYFSIVQTGALPTTPPTPPTS
jgi:predicted Zn-dependent peptidase